jgi:hypothetical protein
MTDTNKLAELIKKAKLKMWGKTFHSELERNMFVADYLLANGVIALPCKVGDTVYIVTNVSQEIVESVVIGIWAADGVFSILTIHGTVIADNIGKKVFLTKEEAEAKLKEMKQ